MSIAVTLETERREPEDRIEFLEGQLRALEGRDLQLWAFGTFIAIVLIVSLVVALQPSLVLDFWGFLRRADQSPELTLGLFAMLLVSNGYLYHERNQLRKTRRELVRQLLILEKSTQIDTLTGAFSRRCLDKLLRKEISRAQRNGTKMSVLVVDVDNFKSFNTQFGHLVGDQVLTQITKVLQSAVRASDIVVRYGGDEFVLLMGDTGEEQAQVAEARIHEYLQAWNKSNRQYQVSVTCGVAEYTEGIKDSDLIKLADEAMLARKSPVHAG
jgi:diguanylate cyclase (GGDEF)-like protein